MGKVWKVFSILLLSMGLIFSITACGGDTDEHEEGLEEEEYATENSQEDSNNQEIDESVDDTEEEEPIKEEETVDPNEFQGKHFTSEIEEDQALSNWIKNKKFESDVYQYPEDEKIYMIAGGERNTGGYFVQITEEKLEGENLTLYYEIHSPGPEDMVTQAITYPYLLIRIAEEVEKVDFVKQ